MLTSVASDPRAQGEALKREYRRWKTHKLKSGKFFPVWMDFRPFLPRLSGGALKLYLFLGLVSKNYTGESWYSNRRLAEKLGCSERAIQAWMAELRENGLVERLRLREHGVAFTYLRPYGEQSGDGDEGV